MSNPVQSGLWHCPGFHSPNLPNDIRPAPMSEILTSNRRVELPIFQRKYCWDKAQLRLWWQDLLTKASGTFQTRTTHGVGKIILMPGECCNNNDSIGSSTWLCIDGQQRITTSMIVLSALRDLVQCIHREAEQDLAVETQELAHTIVDSVNGVLFCVPKGAAWSISDIRMRPDTVTDILGEGRGLEEGFTPEALRLIATWEDRESFLAVVSQGISGRPWCDEEVLERAAVKSSCQYQAYKLITKIATDSINQRFSRGSSPRDEREYVIQALKFLASAVRNQIFGISYMHVGVSQAEHAQQMFQWLQERHLQASLLVYNSCPGVDFTATDLARNYMLSFFLQDRVMQEEVYVNLWLPLNRAILKRAEIARDMEKGTSPSAHQPIPVIADEMVAQYLSARASPVAKMPGIGKGPSVRAYEIYTAFSVYVKKYNAEIVGMNRHGEEANVDSVAIEAVKNVMRDMLEYMCLDVKEPILSEKKKFEAPKLPKKFPDNIREENTCTV